MASTSPAAANTKPFRIAVMLEGVQLSDIVGIDILGNLSHEYVKLFGKLEPAYGRYLPQAPHMEFFFLGQTLNPAAAVATTTTTTTTALPDLEDALTKAPPCAPFDALPWTTPGLRFAPNATYDSCPRDLDVLLIGGNAPGFRPEAAARFLREAWPRTAVVMTTCIGSMWLASSGVLDGGVGSGETAAAKEGGEGAGGDRPFKMTTNRGFLHAAKAAHPAVEWLDQRWAVEEKPYNGGKGALWTSGGAGAGIEMVATYCLENFDHEFVHALALEPLQFDLKGGQFYKN